MDVEGDNVHQDAMRDEASSGRVQWQRDRENEGKRGRRRERERKDGDKENNEKLGFEISMQKRDNWINKGFLTLISE